jgi:hypothetical protein
VHHDLADVLTAEIADPDAAIVGLLAVEPADEKRRGNEARALGRRRRSGV